MAKAKKLDLSTMSVEDLNNRASELIDETYVARMKLRLGQFKRTSDFKLNRKEVARIQTELTARKLADQKNSQTGDRA